MDRLCDLLSLRGKVSLITGAASGIGEAMALRFGEVGSDLYLVDVDEEGLRRVAGRVKGEFGVDVRSFRVDLRSKAEVDRLWGEIRGSEPDVLVNNAGVYLFRDFLEVNEDFLELTLSVNLKSVFWMCQHMIRARKGRGGVIINVGSIEAVLPFAKGLVHYDVSKIGVIGLSRALAREYGKDGFRVIALVPGGIETKGVEKLKREAILKLKIDVIKTGVNFMSRLPLGRMGKPDEVARMAVVLASDLASYVTGAVIPVDGGFLSA
ncbi:MAG: SDR family oxidoreductase [Desulfurococcales archaeon]|nr:SDR family oxidoreductase [Desulfurococcales archaeon]